MAYKNVREPFEIRDTLCICRTLFGSEAAAGFFTTFVQFSAQIDHLFFKTRSEGNCALAYNNQQAADRSDFVFHAFSIGVHFFAPCTPMEYHDDQGAPDAVQTWLQSFWIHEMPRHTSLSFRVGQDEKLLAQSMMLAPGYGPACSGAAFGRDVITEGDQPEFVWTGTQGSPDKRNRFWFGSPEEPKPIAIPKNEIIEARLSVSQYARRVLANAGGPADYFFGQDTEGSDFTNYPTRYGIQVTLYGIREVQQRGELRAS